jgi:hypothetical protein
MTDSRRPCFGAAASLTGGEGRSFLEDWVVWDELIDLGGAADCERRVAERLDYPSLFALEASLGCIGPIPVAVRIRGGTGTA